MSPVRTQKSPNQKIVKQMSNQLKRALLASLLGHANILNASDAFGKWKK